VKIRSAYRDERREERSVSDSARRRQTRNCDRLRRHLCRLLADVAFNWRAKRASCFLWSDA